MLISFTASNFRSIGEPLTLSMVAERGSELVDSNVLDAMPGLRLVSTAALYGPNASGKSNFFRALFVLQWLVQWSAALQQGQALPVAPFRLATAYAHRPSEFEVHFISDGVRYQYGVAATTSRIVSEWLLAYPHGAPQRWFERTQSDSGETTWKLGRSFEGSAAQRKLWKESTRDNALFLSTAIQLNNTQLRPIFNWITQGLVVLIPGVDMNPMLSIELLRTPTGAQRMADLLLAADVGIDRLELQEDDVPPSGNAALHVQIQFGKDGPIVSPPPPKRIKLSAWHTRADDGAAVAFDLSDESDGTQKIFQYAGGLLKAMDSGATVCVDELDRSLHPHLTRFLVRQFQKPHNKNNAQLVFTAHDATLLDSDLLRRDQIWFIDKDQRHQSNLYALLDYSPRKGEALERGYLKGRYRAVPILRDPA